MPTVVPHARVSAHPARCPDAVRPSGVLPAAHCAPPGGGGGGIAPGSGVAGTRVDGRTWDGSEPGNLPEFDGLVER